MESRQSKDTSNEVDHEAILAQIQALQAKLPPSMRSVVTISNQSDNTSSSKRKSTSSNAVAGTVIVVASPSPKKRKLGHGKPFTDRETGRPAKKIAPLLSTKPSTVSSGSRASIPPSKLAHIKTHGVVVSRPTYSKISSTPRTTQNRSGLPEDKGRQPSVSTSKAERDDTLAIVEKLEPGPYEHEPPIGDPSFNTFEPNSCINLSSRKMPHEDLQELLRGRYHLSPSLLYSVVRLQPSKQGYDVPVDGEWITIAVVAERGKVQVTRNAVHRNGDDDSDDENAFEAGPEETKKPNKKKAGHASQQSSSKNTRGKKYTNLTLVDFGHKASRTSSAGVSSVSSSAGDALLRLLLFESDSVSTCLKDESGSNIKGTALYRGGSGGAFEEFYPRLREGTVVAIMSPRVLKPYQGKTNADNQKLHPTNNILGITPTSADTIKIIGHSKDLGMCEVKMKNGGVCGSWCDKRVAQVCEYHMIAAIKSKKSQRAEFSAGTSSVGLGPTALGTRKNGPSGPGSKSFDPNAKWGLLPATATGNKARSDGQGSTYVMSGVVVSAADAQHISAKKQKEFNERIKKNKEMRERDDEELLKKLFQKDAGSVGMREVKNAQAFLKKERSKVKGKEKETGDSSEDDEDDEEVREREKRRSKLRNAAYNPQILKRLGFDPTLKPGEAPKTKTGSSAFQLPKRSAEIDLGPKPGPRIRSGVLLPAEKRFELKNKSETRGDSPTASRPLHAPVTFDSDDDLELDNANDDQQDVEINEESMEFNDDDDLTWDGGIEEGHEVRAKENESTDEEVPKLHHRRSHSSAASRRILDDTEDMDADVDLSSD